MSSSLFLSLSTAYFAQLALFFVRVRSSLMIRATSAWCQGPARARCEGKPRSRQPAVGYDGRTRGASAGWAGTAVCGRGVRPWRGLYALATNLAGDGASGGIRRLLLCLGRVAVLLSAIVGLTCAACSDMAVG